MRRPSAAIFTQIAATPENAAEGRPRPPLGLAPGGRRVSAGWPLYCPAENDQRMKFSRIAFLAAPILMLVYGVIRLFDGHRGPGIGWTAGHFAYLAAAILFVPVCLELRRIAATSHRRTADVLCSVSLLGLLAIAVQAAIDLVIGLRAADKAAMRVLGDQVQSHAGVTPAIYTVGPVLFYLGVVALVALLAVSRRAGVWTPFVMLAGTLMPAINLDLIPVGACCFLLVTAPMVLKGEPAKMESPALRPPLSPNAAEDPVRTL